MFFYSYKHQPLLWLGFIDDIVIIWMHEEEALKDFVEYLNLRVEPMNVTVEWSYDRVNLIDN
jgi:hypothetical protein